MFENLPCPDAENLKRLVVGQLPGQDAEPLEQHLLHCGPCGDTVQAMKVEDTLISAMRGARQTSAQGPEGKIVEGLIFRLQELRPLCRGADPQTSLDTIGLGNKPPGEMTAGAVPPEIGQPSTGATLALGAGPTLEKTELIYDFLAPAQTPGELGRLGSYRVLKVLGLGGMGVVFQAEDPNLQRLVALKAMLPALASNSLARQRFLREAQAAAAIEHDHIVHINQVGEERGVPFLAMPLLKGEPLDGRLKRENKLPVPLVLRIGREIAEGLAAAHERGLIHRDVKPGNIWLEGSRARVKILDFGLARATTDAAHLTQTGAILGTPAFMAPEQTRTGAVDHRADLFSLGCVLYRMVTGKLPFKGSDTMSILTSLALDNPQPPCELDPNIPSKLADLIMQLLAKKPQERPQTAQIVVEKIRAIEQGQVELTNLRKTVLPAEPVLKPSSGVGAGVKNDQTKPLRAGPLLAQSWTNGFIRPWVPIAVVMGMLGWGGYLFGPAVYRIATNRGQLVIESDDPDIEVVVKKGGQQVTIIDPKSGKEITLAAGPYQLELTSGKDGLTLSTDQFTLERGGRQVVRVRMENPPPNREKTSLFHAFEGHEKPVNSVALSADGHRAASSSRDGTVRLWDVDSGKEIRRFESGDAVSVAISPDGRRILGGTLEVHGFRGAVLWDADSGQEVQHFPMGVSWPNGVAFSADCRHALVTGLWNTFVLWDVETGKQVQRFSSPGKIVTSVAISRDGRWALSGSDHETVFRLWNVEKGTMERVFTGHQAAIKAVAFSPEGRRVLSGSEDDTVRLWDISNGQELHLYKGHTDFVNSVAFTADGQRIISGSSDGMVRLWDVLTGKELHQFSGHTGAVLSVAVAGDGRRAISGGEDKSIRLWELPPVPASERTGQVRQFDGNTEPVLLVGFAQAGRQVLSVSHDSVRQWDVATGKPTAPPWELAKYPTLVSLSPEGRHIVIIYGSRTVFLWEVDPRKQLPELLPRGSFLTSANYSGDGKRLIGANHPLDTEPPAIQVWDIQTRKQIRLLEGHKEGINAVALSQDGRLALSSGQEGVRLWDVETGQIRFSLGRPTIISLAFSPDGHRALLGDGMGAVVSWDLETGKETLSFSGHKGPVNCIAFSPDGVHALSGGDDQTVRLWETTSGKEMASFSGHTGKVTSVAFSPDGHQALSGSFDKSVRLWTLPELPGK